MPPRLHHRDIVYIKWKHYQGYLLLIVRRQLCAADLLISGRWFADTSHPRDSRGYEIVAGQCRRFIPTPTTAASTSGSTTSVTTFTDATAIIRPIEILWQESDLPLISPIETVRPGTTSPTTPDPTAVPPTTLPPTPTPPDGGLRTEAKIGIGVGVGVAGLICIAILVFFLFRKRRRRTTPQLQVFATAELPSNPTKRRLAELGGAPEPRTYELTGGGHDGQGAKHELEGRTWANEPPAQVPPAELPAQTKPHELEKFHLETQPPVSQEQGLLTRDEPGGSFQEAASGPATVDGGQNSLGTDLPSPEDSELRWLEEEEARIKARKAQLLKRSQIGG